RSPFGPVPSTIAFPASPVDCRHNTPGRRSPAFTPPRRYTYAPTPAPYTPAIETVSPPYPPPPPPPPTPPPTPPTLLPSPPPVPPLRQQSARRHPRSFCFPFPFSRLTFPVYRFTFTVSLFPFPVSRFTFPVSRFPFPFPLFTFPVPPPPGPPHTYQ